MPGSLDAKTSDAPIAVQRLIAEYGLTAEAATAVLVLDRRLLGLDAHSPTASMVTVARNDPGGDAEPVWKVTGEAETTIAAALSSAFEWPGLVASGRPALVLYLDIVGLDLAALCRAAESLRDRFASIEVLAFAGLGDAVYGEALLRHGVEEARIVLRAARSGGHVAIERREARPGFVPSPIAAARFATTAGQFLQQLAQYRRSGEADPTVCLRMDLGSILSDEPGEVDHPLFSIVTRTRGTRNETLAEVFDGLAAQTCGDFEHLVVGHNLDATARRAIDDLIERQPQSMRQKIRLCTVEGGNRTVPLNHGFARTRGLYTVILDDDDLVLPHWLDTFRLLALAAPGQLLRAVAVKHHFEQVLVEGRLTARALGGSIHDFGETYDHFTHLGLNRTPAMAVAFPTSLFADLGFRFDEALTTTEDWEFIVRCAGTVGVACSTEVTSVYRWWTNAESSRTEHDLGEWAANRAIIQARIASRPYLIPGEASATARDLSATAALHLAWTADLKDRLAMWEMAFFGRRIFQFTEGGMPERDLIDDAAASLGVPLDHPPDGDRMHLRERVVVASGLFDRAFYLDQNPDVEKAEIDPLQHFIRYGSVELRNPGPDFDPVFYYFTNDDVRRARIEPLFHYVATGRSEGRRRTNRGA